ncbi:MAG: hypothetical protein IJ055_02510 [Oscillospiraceae bacterium]|nr:hypothetical protein [Oscillospiraceae bacterium]
MSGTSHKEIYLVISQTGTWLSRLLAVITKAGYNHASISLDPQLRDMYSFGRRHAYNPIIAGFVKESPYFGTFFRFRREARCVILRITVTPEQHEQLREFLTEMYRNKEQYHYNFLGLVLAAFDVVYRRENHYYCSEFCRDALELFSILDTGSYEGIVKPVDFLESEQVQIVYTGSMWKYAMQCEPPLRVHANAG